MRTGVPVSEIMTRKLITLNVKDNLNEAKTIFEENSLRHIPIVSDKTIVGMLSYSDLLKVSYADVSEDDHNIETFVYDWFTIQQVMTKNLFVVSPSTTVKEVAELLAKKEFHALPVVEDGELVGIVTTTDLISYLVSQM